MAKQAAQKEATDARKKKKAEVAHRKYKKEKEVARCVKAGEGKSDIESELESEDPIDVDDMVFSKEAERHAVVPVPRKRAASVDAVGEWEAKRMRSPCPSVALPVPSPPTVDVAEQGERSEEWASTRASPGSVPVRHSQSEEAKPAALVGASQAEGHSGPQGG